MFHILIRKDTETYKILCNFLSVVNVCHDEEVTSTGLVQIDTSGVQYNRLTSCDCVIKPSRQPMLLSLNILHSDGRANIKFKINEIEVGKFYLTGQTNIKGATKLIFSTLEDFTQGGACLSVYTRTF